MSDSIETLDCGCPADCADLARECDNPHALCGCGHLPLFDENGPDGMS